MANFKRKRPKQHRVTSCGIAGCRYDSGHMQTNGVWRYPAMYWKKMGGRKAWRYIHKNV